jgi:FtsH-binding integral membrane protein
MFCLTVLFHGLCVFLLCILYTIILPALEPIKLFILIVDHLVGVAEVWRNAWWLLGFCCCFHEFYSCVPIEFKINSYEILTLYTSIATFASLGLCLKSSVFMLHTERGLDKKNGSSSISAFMYIISFHLCLCGNVVPARYVTLCVPVAKLSFLHG